MYEYQDEQLELPRDLDESADDAYDAWRDEK